MNLHLKIVLECNEVKLSVAVKNSFSFVLFKDNWVIVLNMDRKRWHEVCVKDSDLLIFSLEVICVNNPVYDIFPTAEHLNNSVNEQIKSDRMSNNGQNSSPVASKTRHWHSARPFVFLSTQQKFGWLCPDVIRFQPSVAF